MGHTSSRLPTEIVELIFTALQPSTPGPSYDASDDDCRPFTTTYPTLRSLCLVSKELNRAVTPLLYREIEITLGSQSRVEDLSRTLHEIPERLRWVRKMYIREPGRTLDDRDDGWMVIDQQSEALRDMMGWMSTLNWIVFVKVWEDYEEEERFFRYDQVGVAFNPAWLFSMLSRVTGQNNSRLSRLELIGLGEAHTPPDFTAPALPHLRHLRLSHTIFPPNFISANLVPNLQCAHWDRSQHLTDIPPNLRDVVLAGYSNSYELCLQHCEQLETLYISTSGHGLLRTDHPWLDGVSIVKVSLPPLDHLTFSFRWDSIEHQEEDRKDALEQIRHKLYGIRSIRKLTVLLYNDGGEEERKCVVAAAKTILAKEGTVLEIRSFTLSREGWSEEAV